MVARGPALLPIQSADPRGIGCPSTQHPRQAQSTDKGLSGHGETAPPPPSPPPPPQKKQNKKSPNERQAWNNTGSVSGHIQLKLTVLPAAQLVQQHTSSSLTQSQPETHHSSSSSPPPRHMTMHMHPPSAFNIQYSNIFTISNLRLKLYTILTMHGHPARAFYTHYYNISIAGYMLLEVM